jgi:DNA-binding NtrC family response regulator
MLQPMKALAGQRILIAEDETLIALELEEVLQDLGCEIIGPVTRVKDVHSRIQTCNLDGALLDVNLRGEQIFTVLPQLIEQGVPLIITSGYADATLFPESFRALPRIAKPFDAAALRRLCVATFAKG